MYVNTTAEVKALDRLLLHVAPTPCRSSSTSRRARAGHAEILFGPDMLLGAYVEKELGEQLHVWDGECHVHAGIRPADINADARRAPGRRLPHPPRVRLLDAVMEYVAAGDVASEGVHMLSTGGMLELRQATREPGREAIVATETGMLHPLRMAAPDVDFIAANEAAVCRYMKMITLPKLRDALRDLKHEVRVPEDIARARAHPDRAHGRDRVACSRRAARRELECPRPRRRSHDGGAATRALALELGRRVAVHVGLGAHLGGVPERARLVDALQPRHAVEVLAHEHDDELRAALALMAGAAAGPPRARRRGSARWSGQRSPTRRT